MPYCLMNGGGSDGLRDREPNGQPVGLAASRPSRQKMGQERQRPLDLVGLKRPFQAARFNGLLNPARGFCGRGNTNLSSISAFHIDSHGKS